MNIEPQGPRDSVRPPPPPPSRPQTVEAHVAQQLTQKAQIDMEKAKFLAEIEEMIAEVKAMSPRSITQVPKPAASPLKENPYQPIPPSTKKVTSDSAEVPRPEFIPAAPDKALLQKKFIVKTEAKPSAWGAALRLVGRAAAVIPSLVLLPIAFLSLISSTAVGKVINAASGKQVVGRPLKEPPKGTQFEKMKARFFENAFRSDLDVMYHGIRAVGDPREDVKIISAALLSIVKK